MAKYASHDDHSFPCPHCGAEVVAGASFCRECGASDESGWGDDEETYDGFASGYGEDDDFDYEAYLQREFPAQSHPSAGQRFNRWTLAVLVILVCVALLFWTF